MHIWLVAQPQSDQPLVSLTNELADIIIRLWNALDPYDKHTYQVFTMLPERSQTWPPIHSKKEIWGGPWCSQHNKVNSIFMLFTYISNLTTLSVCYSVLYHLQQKYSCLVPSSTKILKHKNK